MLSPHDKELIQSQLGGPETEAWPVEHMKLETDESIARGGCRIETEFGDIDATIETQLRVLKSTLWNDAD
jgi:flagellar assembly protein FliH